MDQEQSRVQACRGQINENLGGDIDTISRLFRRAGRVRVKVSTGKKERTSADAEVGSASGEKGQPA